MTSNFGYLRLKCLCGKTKTRCENAFPQAADSRFTQEKPFFFKISLPLFADASITPVVGTSVTTGAIRSRSPEYDCSPDAALRIKEDYHVSRH
jgi:hypothetical protein